MSDGPLRGGPLIDVADRTSPRPVTGSLKADRYLVGRPADQFAQAAAKYVNEINAAHPFIDGDGRTQRFWLRMLTANAGFELRLTERDLKSWNDASRRGFERADHEPMAAMLKKRLA